MSDKPDPGHCCEQCKASRGKPCPVCLANVDEPCRSVGQAQQVLRDLGCPWDEINAAPNLVIGRPAGLDLAVALDLDPAAVA